MDNPAQPIPDPELDHQLNPQNGSPSSPKKSLLPIFLIILGLLGFLISGVLFNIVFQLTKLTQELNVATYSNRAYINFAVVLLYSLGDIIFGLHLFLQQRHTNLSARQRTYALNTIFISLLFGLIAFPIFIVSAIQPIYSLISGIDDTPTSVVSENLSPTPVPEQSANWKTYTNSKIGFTIKYPPDWAASAPSYTPRALDNRQGFHDYADNFYSPEMVKYQTENPQNLGLSPGDFISYQFINKQVDLSDSNIALDYTSKIIGVSKLTMGDRDAAYLIFDKKTGLSNEAVIPVSQGTLYFDLQHIETQGTDVLFKQILSTIKFTDSQTADTSNWKNYTNTNYNLSFKYPPGLNYLSEGTHSNIDYDPATGKQRIVTVGMQNSDASVVFYQYPNPQKLNINQWIDENFPKIYGTDFNKDTFKLGQKQYGKFLVYIPDIGKLGPGYLIANNDRIIEIHGLLTTKEQILSTLNLTN